MSFSSTILSTNLIFWDLHLCVCTNIFFTYRNVLLSSLTCFETSHFLVIVVSLIWYSLIFSSFNITSLEHKMKSSLGLDSALSTNSSWKLTSISLSRLQGVVSFRSLLPCYVDALWTASSRSYLCSWTCFPVRWNKCFYLSTVGLPFGFLTVL